MGGFQNLDIVLFAMVAVFIALRLRSVLGRRTGNERQQPSRFDAFRDRFSGGATRPPEPPRPAGPIIDGKATTVDEPAAATSATDGLAQIRAIDPSITSETFLAGARAAFEMILHAFTQGDENALRPLLASEVFDNFAKVIRTRREAGETCENQLVNIVSADIDEAHLAGAEGRITVRFVSQQIIVVKTAQGAVVEGDPAKTATMHDLWTFARDLRARNPNWALVATRSQDE